MSKTIHVTVFKLGITGTLDEEQASLKLKTFSTFQIQHYVSLLLRC